MLWDRTEEIRVQRSTTVTFINADPVAVVLIPRIKTIVKGAAKFVDDTPRAPQTMKLIMQSAAGGSIEQHTGDGTERRTDFQLLGAWDSQGDIGDHWQDSSGQWWEVTAVVPDNGYERRFVIESYGKHPTGG